MDAATILTFTGVLAFAPAAMLVLGVIAFVRTLRLRAALVRAHARIDALEAALQAAGAPTPPQAAAPQPIPAPAPTAPAQAAPAPAPAAAPIAAAPPLPPPPPQPAPPPRPEPAPQPARVAAPAPDLPPTTPPLPPDAAATRQAVRKSPAASTADWTAIGIGAGFAIAFGAVWAAAQAAPAPLIPGPIALGLMAGFGATALGLSLRLGPWFVLLGLALSYAAPALVTLARPAPEALFAYLAAICAAALAIIKVRDWRILPWFALGGALLWAVLWLAFAFNGGAQIAVSAYLVAIAATAGAFGWTAARADAFATPNEETALAAVGIIGASLVLLALTHVTGHAAAPAIGLFVLAGLAIGAAIVREGLALAAIGVATLALGAIVDWPALPPAAGTGPRLVLGVTGLVSAGAALGFTSSVGGWLMMARHRRPEIGAWLAALAPALILGALHWKSDGFGPSWAWSATALFLAALTAFTLRDIVRRIGRTPEAAGPAGAFAVGAALATGFAALFSLDGFLLGAGLALIVPACAWFDRQYDVAALKGCAAIAAASAAVLLLPPLALFHPVSTTPILNVILPSYLIAAGALLAGARLFDQTVGRDDTLLVQTLEAAALLLAAILLSAEVRHLANGGAMTAPYAGLAEVGGHTIVWLVYALTLAWRFGPTPRPLLFIAEAVALAAALGNAALMGLVIVNPWWGATPAPTPGWPVANVLAIAYAAPAALLALYAHLRFTQGMVGRSGGAAAASALLAFVAVTLEVRRMAHGPLDVQSPPVGLGEGWAMLAAWGALAAMFALLGLWRRSRLLTLASVALALAAGLKGFLVDAPALDGLARPIAFFALAAATLLLAFAYVRALGPRAAGAPAYVQPSGDPNLLPPQDVR